MTKGKIIALSVISGVLIAIVILFSFVFCLYHEEVYYLEDVEIASVDIIESSGLKHGTPIFAINKDKAIASIEKAYPHIRVEGIRTTSVRAVEIVVSKRQPVYQNQKGEQYYIFDEDLKLLDIADSKQVGLIEINLELLDMQLGEFDSSNDANVLNELFNASFMYIKRPNNENVYDYLTREQICSFITKASIDNENDNLTLKLNDNLEISISKPTDRLTEKINLAFSTYNTLYDRELANNNIDNMGEKFSIIVTYQPDGTFVAGIHNIEASD